MRSIMGQKIIIGIGGSVTNDGGAGMIQARCAFVRQGRAELTRGGGALDKLAQIDLTQFDQRILLPKFW